MQNEQQPTINLILLMMGSLFLIYLSNAIYMELDPHPPIHKVKASYKEHIVMCGEHRHMERSEDKQSIICVDGNPGPLNIN